jgi:hypothetical protein
MRIAFDLDDTLIPCGHSFPVESPRGLFGRWLAREALRHGTTDLLRRLAEMGCDLWVYTTSLRRPSAIRFLFRCYGVRLGGVVNQESHMKWLRRCAPRLQTCSKYPPAFNIDLLIDDSEGVQLEARKHRYAMVLISPNDDTWTTKVLAAVHKLLGKPSD